jgi:hypothetical protein
MSVERLLKAAIFTLPLWWLLSYLVIDWMEKDYLRAKSESRRPASPSPRSATK